MPGQWQLAGFSQGYAVFTLRKPPVPISASTAGGRPLPVQVISSTTKSEAVKVDAPAPAWSSASVAWDSGWRATVSVNGGPAADDSGRRHSTWCSGSSIPAGDDVVTFHYRPPHLLVASVLSLGAQRVPGVLLGLAGPPPARRGRQPVCADAGPNSTVTGVPEHVG